MWNKSLVKLIGVWPHNSRRQDTYYRR